MFLSIHKTSPPVPKVGSGMSSCFAHKVRDTTADTPGDGRGAAGTDTTVAALHHSQDNE